jgi:carboxylesterase type B
VPLLSETAFEAIIVMPSYRLNLFGFLSSRELQAETGNGSAGNMGFWDQRTALEWTAKNISYFSGDPNNITVGGYSAGAHSAFHQLAHELYYVPETAAIIKRVICWSNSPGVQPKDVFEQQRQFDELLTTLGISLQLPSAQKLEKLRAIPAVELVDVQERLNISEFRATSDNSFVSKQLIANINSGDFAKRIKARNIRFMNGECKEEHNLYRSWRTPADTYEAVRRRLIADFPELVADKLMMHYCGKSKTLPPSMNDWPDLFGHIYANMQVHHLERGFHNTAHHSELVYGKDVFRYRIDWRAQCVDSAFPPEWGVTHATDLAIWFWGLGWGHGLTEDEKEILAPWNQAFADFVKGGIPQWKAHDVKQMQRLRADGQTDVCTDIGWNDGLQVWDLVNGDFAGIIGWLRSKL